METVTWTAVVLAGISLIGTIADKINSRKMARDKLEFDEKLLNLQTRSDQCERQHQECEEKTAKLEAKNSDLEAKVDLCEERHEATAADLAIIKDKLGVK